MVRSPTMKPLGWTRLVSSLAVLLLAAVVACGETGEDGASARGTPAWTSADTVPMAPETKEAIIVIEGMAEPMTLRRYESPEDSPLHFSTYLPEGIEPADEADAGAEEWSVRFVSSFGGEARPGSPGPEGGSLEVVFLPAGTSEADARARAREAAERAGGSPAPDPRSTRWGLTQHPFHSSDLGGSATLGRRGDRFFLLLVRYSPEWGDGFLPRAAWILEEWIWEDEGDPLTPLESS